MQPRSCASPRLRPPALEAGELHEIVPQLGARRLPPVAVDRGQRVPQPEEAQVFAARFQSDPPLFDAVDDAPQAPLRRAVRIGRVKQIEFADSRRVERNFGNRGPSGPVKGGNCSFISVACLVRLKKSAVPGSFYSLNKKKNTQ